MEAFETECDDDRLELTHDLENSSSHANKNETEMADKTDWNRKINEARQLYKKYSFQIILFMCISHTISMSIFINTFNNIPACCGVVPWNHNSILSIPCLGLVITVIYGAFIVYMKRQQKEVFVGYKLTYSYCYNAVSTVNLGYLVMYSMDSTSGNIFTIFGSVLGTIGFLGQIPDIRTDIAHDCHTTKLNFVLNTFFISIPVLMILIQGILAVYILCNDRSLHSTLSFNGHAPHFLGDQFSSNMWEPYNDNVNCSVAFQFLSEIHLGPDSTVKQFCTPLVNNAAYWGGDQCCEWRFKYFN